VSSSDRVETHKAKPLNVGCHSLEVSGPVVYQIINASRAWMVISLRQKYCSRKVSFGSMRK